MIDSGQIVINDAALGAKAEVFRRGGATAIGVRHTGTTLLLR